MGIKDEATGRVKEAVGAITDDDSLRHEGKADRVAGKVKDAIDSAKDKLGDAADDLRAKHQDTKH